MISLDKNKRKIKNSLNNKYHNSNPIFFRFFRISFSSLSDSSKSSPSSLVSLSIFSSNGMPSSSSGLNPTYLPGVSM